MKHNNLTERIGLAAFTIIFILSFVIGFALLHQIINFLITYQGTGLHQYR
ncbi:MAG TPA: hypothetical protein VEV62_04145 [Parafilimonas sp.]|nr:hypothetical protein [Parafilimonas sp.]